MADKITEGLKVTPVHVLNSGIQATLLKRRFMYCAKPHRQVSIKWKNNGIIQAQIDLKSISVAV